MSTQFTKLRVDIETVLQKNQVKSDTIGQEMQRSIALVNGKLAQMDDAEEIKRWVQDNVMMLDTRVRENLQDFNDRA